MSKHSKLDAVSYDYDRNMHFNTNIINMDESRSNSYKLMGINWSSVNKSNGLWCELAVDAYRRGYLTSADVSNAKLQRLRDGSRVAYSSMPHLGVSNGSGSTSKSITFSSTGDNHEPRNEVNRASSRLADRRYQFELVKAFLESQKLGFQAYFLTLTTPNVSVGELQESSKDLAHHVSQLIKALKDGTDRGSGFQLISADTEPVKFLGSLINFETTVNPDSLKEAKRSNTFHPHAHIILILDRKVDSRKTADLLFDKWKQLNNRKRLSRDAFSFISAYLSQYRADDEDESDYNPALDSAIEATKYATKPDSWLRLAHCKNKAYASKVFAELYRYQHHIQANRATGVMWEAVHFANQLDAFRNAISFKMSGEMPEVFTKLIDFHQVTSGNDSGRTSVKFHRNLNDEELLYFNRDLIKNLFSTYSISDFDLNGFIKDVNTMIASSNPMERGAGLVWRERMKPFVKENKHHFLQWMDALKTLSTYHSKDETLDAMHQEIHSIESTLRHNHENSRFFEEIRNKLQPEQLKEMRSLLLSPNRVFALRNKAKDLHRLVGAIYKYLSPKADAGVRVGSQANSFNTLPRTKASYSKHQLNWLTLEQANDINKDTLFTRIDKIPYSIEYRDAMMDWRLSIPMFVFLSRKFELMFGYLDEFLRKTGLDYHNLTDGQIVSIIRRLTVIDKIMPPSHRHYDYKHHKVSIDSSSPLLTDANFLNPMQNKMLHNYSVEFYLSCGANHLDSSSQSNIVAPLLTFGFAYDDNRLFHDLFGDEPTQDEILKALDSEQNKMKVGA